jgi:hypothetical protein
MWRKVMSAYWFAVFVAIMAIVPGCNVVYTFHGGPGWPLHMLVFPTAVLRLSWLFITTTRSDKKRMAQVILSSLAVYAVVSLCVSCIAAWSIERTFELSISPLEFWGTFFFPFYIPPPWRS